MSMSPLEERLERVRDRISATGRDPDNVRIVAVTKGFDSDVVRDALRAGLVDVGESYVQELVAKAAELGPGERTNSGGSASLGGRQPPELEAQPPVPCWHFVGRLQRNKVRKAAPYVSLWHSVDRAELGAEIARRAPGARVLAQVNLSGEAAKGGCAPSGLEELVEALTDLGLAVRGLMTVGPQGPPAVARPAFTELSRLADRYGLPERSMGMSNDLEVALEEGATMLRVGSALFGPRSGGAGPRPGAAPVGD